MPILNTSAAIGSKPVEFFDGFFTGNLIATVNDKENEVRQGHNHYFGAVCQIGQAYQAATVFGKVADAYFRPAKSIAQNPFLILGTLLITVPVSFFSALVKQGHYQPLAKLLNDHRIFSFKVPAKLDKYTQKIATFINDHGSKVLKGAIVVSAVALIAFGNTFFGSALLVAIGYNELDQRGWIPRKISLFVETYLPVVSTCGSILLANPVSRFISAISLPFMIGPEFGYIIQHKLDKLAHEHLGIGGPLLEQAEAAVVQNKNLTKAQIYEILDAGDESFEVNPAHCTKWMCDMSKLPSDYNFDKLQPMFDSINWVDRYDQIKPKLNTDEIFIKFLLEQFPSLGEAEVIARFDECIEELARRKNISVQQYAADWIRQQMQRLISGLMGRHRVAGTQQDLDDAIQNTCKLVPFIENLTKPEDLLEKEDMLLKLALEAGDYCARGLKRASNELLGNLMQRAVNNDDNIDALGLYERKIGQAMQQERYSIMQDQYEKLIGHVPNLPTTVKRDVHTLDLYRSLLSLGFYPLTSYERAQMGISMTWAWETYSQKRQKMLEEYNPYIGIRVVGNLEFATYIQLLIERNPTLSPIEKAEILENFTEINENKWHDKAFKSINHRYHRLVLVMLGILKKK